MLALEEYVRSCGIDEALLDLVRLCASYLNGCSYCVDMHTKDARARGETEQRLYAVAVWRDTPFFTPRERAALAWTEAVTELGREGVSDQAYAAARAHFDEAELARLTVAIVAINGWNRLNIAFRSEAGAYQPRAREAR
jgi:AhpD family alkylhydroperoxidase